MKYTFFLSTFLLLALFSACTYSVTVVHTEGTASDVVDDTDDIKADVSPTLSIPASVIP